MKINNKLRLQLLVQNGFFVIIFLVLIFLLAYLSNQYSVSKDITQANRNILTRGSVDILKQMKAPINVTVYATKDDPGNGDNFRKDLVGFFAKYVREKKDINIGFVNPSEEPKRAQDAGVKQDGEVVVEYNKRTEHINPPFTEQEMTNLLVRLSRSNQRPIMYLDTHGERNLQGIKNYDLGEFGKMLESKGFKFANINLILAQAVPANGSMLVIAAPKIDLDAIEAKKIREYIEAGGNLLWLVDDENLHGLNAVADYLGMTVSKGMVVDLASSQYKYDSKNAISSAYGDHAITRTFQYGTMYPEAREVDAHASYELGWKVARLVEVAQRGWLETEPIINDGKQQKVTYDSKKDKAGPITIALALEREYGKRGQRVVVVGNANFLSNTYITTFGNLDFGLNIINWLAGDDNLITIQPMPLKDVNMSIPEGSISAKLVGYGTQYIVPVLLMLLGIGIWWRRKKA